MAVAQLPRARVLVVEDDPFVRAGIVDLLAGRTDLICCDQVGSIAAATQSVHQHQPDLVLMDLKLEDGDALGLINTLRLQFPAMGVLVLSHQEETLYAQKALEAGARGYLMKESAAEHLHNAISIVLSGSIYLSQSMAARLGPRLPGSSPGLPKRA